MVKLCVHFTVSMGAEQSICIQTNQMKRYKFLNAKGKNVQQHIKQMTVRRKMNIMFAKMALLPGNGINGFDF